ncbi:16684_t:CDS:2, partial [Dentiscutata heterogama]
KEFLDMLQQYNIEQYVTIIFPEQESKQSKMFCGSAVKILVSEYVADYYSKNTLATYFTGEAITIAVMNDKFNPRNLW